MKITLECITFLTSVCVCSVAVPIILKESSPSGEAFIAIAASDSDFKKYFNFASPSDTTQEKIVEQNNSSRVIVEQNNPAGVIGRTFSIVSPVGAAAGTGRGFISTSAFNPFLLPLFFNPINFEGIGLNNFATLNNWFKGIDGIYDRGFGGNGEMKKVSAINDNGHIYGNVKTITFDHRPPASSN